MTAAALSRVGTVLDGKYELVRRLGAGGMSEVYEAKHLRLGRRVAIKFLLPDLATRPELIARFRNEARAAGALQHENIAAVYDVGELDDGMQYLVMELLTGTDCAAALRATGRFDALRAVELVIQLCRGLSVAHTHDIVHRDLKPANLFLCQRADGSDLLKIFDFGIAKLRHSPDAGLSTATGEALGTPCYMSPEQARGDRDIDERTDVYAAGVILYELLSGQRPFDGTSSLQVLHRILTQAPVPIEQLRTDLPAGLSAVVHRALAREREQRFESSAQLLAALRPFVGAQSSPEPRQIESAAALDDTQPDSHLESNVRWRGGRPLLASTSGRAPRRGTWIMWLGVTLTGLTGAAVWFGQGPTTKGPTTSSNALPAVAPAAHVVTPRAESAALMPQPTEASVQSPDAGQRVATQPLAAVPSAPKAVAAEAVAVRARPAKRPQSQRLPTETIAAPALPPPPAPEAPAVQVPTPRAVSGQLKIDHSNPYQ